MIVDYNVSQVQRTPSILFVNDLIKLALGYAYADDFLPFADGISGFSKPIALVISDLAIGYYDTGSINAFLRDILYNLKHPEARFVLFITLRQEAIICRSQNNSISFFQFCAFIVRVVIVVKNRIAVEDIRRMCIDFFVHRWGWLSKEHILPFDKFAEEYVGKFLSRVG